MQDVYAGWCTMSPFQNCYSVLEVEKIQILDWPRNSPDLKPIENLWNVLKDKVSEKQPTNTRRHRLKVIHSRSDTNRTGAEGLSFYNFRLLHCLNQMLAVMLLSQHRVSSSKTVRPHPPCGARCIGHAVSTWSVVAQRRHTCNSVKERDPICAWTNGIAQHQSTGG